VDSVPDFSLDRDSKKDRKRRYEWVSPYAYVRDPEARAKIAQLEARLAEQIQRRAVIEGEARSKQVVAEIPETPTSSNAVTTIPTAPSARAFPQGQSPATAAAAAAAVAAAAAAAVTAAAAASSTAVVVDPVSGEDILVNRKKRHYRRYSKK
jgi:hypothetical protein